ncbi:MAG: 3-deoxy-8-phosphooctulonate synthase [Elusimicrobia bacterium]|nr:3-deoxy-8-phosphooctulonate synthase [Elusimicrobiota bacterium]
MRKSNLRRVTPVRIGGFEASNRGPLFFIAGLCALESAELLARVGRALKSAFARAGARWVLKCSFDKANRSSIRSFRGRGLDYALEAFGRVKKALGVPLLTDIHEPGQAEKAARVADVLQIPAFLCRQTDLLVAAGKTGAAVNIKKGQFLSPWDMRNAVAKVESTGSRRILLTERGSSFGYGDIVADMRSLHVLRGFGYPVVFDATHACQLPGSLGEATGGERRHIPVLARAAVAAGVAGVSFETHPDPDRALSDGPNTLLLSHAAALARDLLAIDRLIKRMIP